MSQPIGDGNVPMETLKQIVRALTGTNESLSRMERDLQGELQVARNKTKEALESLRRMAQDMQWRVSELEHQADEERLRRGGGNDT